MHARSSMPGRMACSDWPPVTRAVPAYPTYMKMTSATTNAAPFAPELPPALHHLRHAEPRALRRVQRHEYGADEVADEDGDDGRQERLAEHRRRERAGDHGQDVDVGAEPEREQMARPAVPLVERDLVDRMLFDACELVLSRAAFERYRGCGHAATALVTGVSGHRRGGCGSHTHHDRARGYGRRADFPDFGLSPEQRREAVFGHRYERPGMGGGLGEIWGYTDALSYPPGATVRLYVSSTAPSCEISIVRDGAIAIAGADPQASRGARWQDTPDQCSVRRLRLGAVAGVSRRRGLAVRRLPGHVHGGESRRRAASRPTISSSCGPRAGRKPAA